MNDSNAALWIGLGVAGLALLGYSAKDAIAASRLISSEDFSKYDGRFRAAALKYGVPDWRWLKAIAWNESTLGTNPRVRNKQVSSDGLSRGIMQLTHATANDMRPGIRFEDLDDPDVSIDLGGKYVGWLYRRYQGDLRKSIMAYNQGPGNTDKGKEYAAEYFKRFEQHLAAIKAAGN